MKKTSKKMPLQTVHIVDKEFLNPVNPILVNVVGAGGTGSQVLTSLSRINHSLIGLNHPGLHVRLFDDDLVTKANLGRQLFSQGEVGQYKSGVLISRVNRFFGTNWKAVPEAYSLKLLKKDRSMGMAQITISCVDTVKSRQEISECLDLCLKVDRYTRGRPKYWMDFGNSRDSGQVILSTVEKIHQPESKKFRAVSQLPKVTEEFGDLLAASEETDTTPSCSLAEALKKQDLFINSSLASLGLSLLWNLLQEGIIFHRGFFLNLKDFRCQPITIT